MSGPNTMLWGLGDKNYVLGLYIFIIFLRALKKADDIISSMIGQSIKGTSSRGNWDLNDQGMFPRGGGSWFVSGKTTKSHSSKEMEGEREEGCSCQRYNHGPGYGDKLAGLVQETTVYCRVWGKGGENEKRDDLRVSWKWVLYFMLRNLDFIA